MLRWVLAILLGWGLVRILRGVSASLSPPGADPKRRSLDPERAVQAAWEEVDDEGAEPRAPGEGDQGTR